MFDGIIEGPKPVIAAVNGAAIGAGCVMALLCDVLVVAEEAFLSMTGVDYGLTGGVRHVLRAFSPSDARLMIYTAKRITGPELYRMNAASVCVPKAQLLYEGTSMTRSIASKVPLAAFREKRKPVMRLAVMARGPTAKE